MRISGISIHFYDFILVVFISLTNFKGRKDSVEVEFWGQ